jgi:ABC-type oligopeptide transport system substrate-binding subunit
VSRSRPRTSSTPSACSGIRPTRAGSGNWSEVTATVVDARTVRFDLATPLGGFLELATQPIAPAHLLRDVPVDGLADDPFGRAPVGSGPFVLTELDDSHAVLEPRPRSSSAARGR